MPVPFFQVETIAGQPILAGGYKTIPFSRVMRIRLPGLPGGLVWNRPASIVVSGLDGEELVIPVQDTTRRAQVAFLAAGLVASVCMWLLFGRRK